MGRSVEIIFAGNWGNLNDLYLRGPDGNKEPLIGDFFPAEYRLLNLTDDQIRKFRAIASRRAGALQSLRKRYESANEHRAVAKEEEYGDEFWKYFGVQISDMDLLLTDNQRTFVNSIRAQEERK
jgi:hypothetical protein